MTGWTEPKAAGVRPRFREPSSRWRAGTAATSASDPAGLSGAVEVIDVGLDGNGVKLGVHVISLGSSSCAKTAPAAEFIAGRHVGLLERGTAELTHAGRS